MNTTTKLELRFTTEDGKSRTLSVNQPALNLEAEDVQTAMEKIAAQEIFAQDGIQLYNQIKGARYVTREVEDLFEIEAI